MKIITHFGIALAILFALLVAGCVAQEMTTSFEDVSTGLDGTQP